MIKKTIYDGIKIAKMLYDERPYISSKDKNYLNINGFWMNGNSTIAVFNNKHDLKKLFKNWSIVFSDCYLIIFDITYDNYSGSEETKLLCIDPERKIHGFMDCFLFELDVILEKFVPNIFSMSTNGRDTILLAEYFDGPALLISLNQIDSWDKANLHNIKTNKQFEKTAPFLKMYHKSYEKILKSKEGSI